MAEKQIRGCWLRQKDGLAVRQHGDGVAVFDPQQGDEGFLLVGAIVLVFLVLLALTVAAPTVAREMQREKEIESQHRANQYVRAIRMYYKKFNHYPSSVEQLENTNHQRFLREKYLDPLTGKDDWRLIHVGENKTKVKGFFGQDLPGLQAGLGSAASLVSTPGSGATTGGAANTSTTGQTFGGTSGSSGAFGSSAGAGSTGAFGASSGAGSPGSGSSSGFGATSSGAGSTSLGGASGGGTGLGGATTAGGTTGTGTAGSGIASQDATSATGTGGAIMGIGSSKSGEAMLAINDQTTYQTWEFLYDPRIEQLYAKANLLGGGVSSGSASSLGSASGLASPGAASGLGAAPGAGTAPGSGAGTGLPSTSPTTPP